MFLSPNVVNFVIYLYAFDKPITLPGGLFWHFIICQNRASSNKGSAS